MLALYSIVLKTLNTDFIERKAMDANFFKVKNNLILVGLGKCIYKFFFVSYRQTNIFLYMNPYLCLTFDIYIIV